LAITTSVLSVLLHEQLGAAFLLTRELFTLPADSRQVVIMPASLILF